LNGAKVDILDAILVSGTLHNIIFGLCSMW
jgi:hypothetical protein